MTLYHWYAVYNIKDASHAVIKKAVANAPMPVTANTNIRLYKSTGRFKITIQETYQYSYICSDTSDVSNDSIFYV